MSSYSSTVEPALFRFYLTTMLVICGIATLCAQEPPVRKYSNVARLQLPRLQAVHEDVLRLQQQRQNIAPLAGFNDYHCVMHAHAEDSTHTGGTLPEMLAEARKTGVHCILLSDHFRPPRDFIDGRWRGFKDGVLFIPGSEIRGFLIHPSKSILNRMDLKTPEFIETVNADNGLIFLSHIEERKDHPVDGLSGLEIYNRHYDAKRDMGSLIAVAMMLTDPKQLEQLQEAVAKFPAELFAFQCDYPTVYLKKWDEGTKQRRLTGVAANDCHHNQVMIVKMVDDKTALVGTNVDQDKDMRKVTTDLRPGLKQLMAGKKPGDVIARVDIDPYSISFRNSSTHILSPVLDERNIRAALQAGHAYVSHDWMCNPTGFQFTARSADQQFIMGDQVASGKDLQFQIKLPVPSYVRLLLHGKEVMKADGVTEASYTPKEPGAYRVEAWLKLDGEYRPWIYSNPIYVK